MNSWEEIQEIQQFLSRDATHSLHSMKICESKGELLLNLVSGRYQAQIKITIPDEYPAGKPLIDVVETNLHPAYVHIFVNQAIEIARVMAEPARTQHQIKFNLPRSDSSMWTMCEGTYHEQNHGW